MRLNYTENKIVISMCIGFCFLTYDNLERIDIWNDFFKSVDKTRYKVYIHAKNPLMITEYYYDFPINIIKNPVQTKGKTDITIVEGTLKLLKDAFKENDDITHFIFLSQSCIPIYDFNKIYDFSKSANKSIISSKENNQKNRYFQMGKEMMKNIPYQKFTKQQPNMILIRDDVAKLTNNLLLHYFKDMTCPDEHYFINILLYIFHTDVIKQQITFCNYDLNRTQGLLFSYIDEKFIKGLRSMGFLFMRKVNKNSMIDNHFLFL